MEHLNDSPALFHFSPLLIRSNIFSVCFASCLALKLPIPLVIPQAVLGKPATTVVTAPPFWDFLLLVVLRLLARDDAFFPLDVLGMMILMRTRMPFP